MFGMIRWARSHFSDPVTKPFSMSTIRSAYRIGFPRSGLRRAGDKPSATAHRIRIIYIVVTIYGYYMAVERLYAWIRTAFGNREFTLWDFRATFPSPNPTKIISDLARRGYLERVARGVYRAIPPGPRLRALAADEEKSFGLAGTSTLPHAYSRETAIAIWTDGGYWIGFTAGFRPLPLDVDRRRGNRWGRPCVLVGGSEISSYWFPRFSVDLDLVLPASEVDGVRTVLRPRGFVRDADRDGTGILRGRFERWIRRDGALPVSVDMMVDGIADRVSGVGGS